MMSKPYPEGPHYLDQCLKNGKTMRWPERTMPIAVYIAPFRWYEQDKQGQADMYRTLVLKTLDTWSKLTHGAVRFTLVPELLQSQMNLKWRRVDRKSLGHCEYSFSDEGVIYSAEISIGISDGVIHAQYNDTNEVYHTLLHEFGHAIGLVGHSQTPGDIMYVPHEYGVTDLSVQDVTTAQLLYRLPMGFDFVSKGKTLGLKAPFTLDDVVDVMAGRLPRSQQQAVIAPELVGPPILEAPEVLHQERAILGELGRYHMMNSQIRVKRQSPPKG